MTRIVLDERGTLDKYIGDAVMAIFGAPDRLSRTTRCAACQAALRMIDEARAADRPSGSPRAGSRSASASASTPATMVVGNIGSEQLFDYTVLGDEVNLGARLESLNKDYQTNEHIIISDGTSNPRSDAIEVRELGEVKVKGKTRPVVIYELLGLKNDAGRVAARGQATRRAATCRSNSSAAYRTARWDKCSPRLQFTPEVPAGHFGSPVPL